MRKGHQKKCDFPLPWGCGMWFPEGLSEHITALKPLFYQLVTTSLRLIAEVLGLGPILGFCPKIELCDRTYESLWTLVETDPKL